jgi:nitroreductase / dihydropteridine reductase
MSLLNKLNWRYATKKFDTEKKLTEAQVNNMIEAFRLAPSSYGLQPWKLLLINNKEKREQLKTVSWNQDQVTDASHLFVLCRQNKIDDAYVEKYIQEVGAAKSMTDLTPLDGYKNMMIGNVVPRPDQEAWMAKQVYIALGFMMSVAAEMDIDTCAMEGFDPIEYSKILDLESKGLTACILLPAGYRSADDTTSSAPKVRKSKSDIFIEIN